MTQILGESRNNSILEKTLNVIGPIKNKFSKARLQSSYIFTGKCNK